MKTKKNPKKSIFTRAFYRMKSKSCQGNFNDYSYLSYLFEISLKLNPKI